ncbi:MAG: response regulator [Rhodospirillaceae bacterium]|nr:response regulator [Rhodospirillaceae bacterium]
MPHSSSGTANTIAPQTEKGKGSDQSGAQGAGRSSHKPESPRAKPRLTAPEQPIGRKPKARVLVIDDDDLVRRTITKILGLAGYSVIPASNGVEGLAMLRRWPIDLVLTDIIMPEKEGLEIIIEVRKRMPGLPIIAISGGGRTRNMTFLALGKKLGADRVLTKPFLPKQLLAAVGACLSMPAASTRSSHELPAPPPARSDARHQGPSEGRQADRAGRSAAPAPSGQSTVDAIRLPSASTSPASPAGSSSASA